ncbi:MAG: SEC-C metal-binding domain-containing protein [Candidatus Cyclobacteriaceae bacterium M3_2C_046]
MNQEFDWPLTPSKPVIIGPKIGRNDPCLCGSGKKYKNVAWARMNKIKGWQTRN